MATLKTQMSNDLSVFFDTDEFAETITYAGVSISAVVSYGKRLDDRGEQSQASLATIAIKVANVASPVYRDSITINSVVWTVRQIVSGDGYIWVLALERDERPIL